MKGEKGEYKIRFTAQSDYGWIGSPAPSNQAWVDVNVHPPGASISAFTPYQPEAARYNQPSVNRRFMIGFT